MRFNLLVLCLLFPALVLGQSLSEVAKKEKERREKNKQEGKKVLVISEEELFPEKDEDSSGASEGAEGSSSTTTGARAPSSEPGGSSEGNTYIDESEEVPTHISADLPLEERLRVFERMKRAYENQVREIDKSIAENDERLRQIEAQIGATSALGGAGLPVAPQTGTGAANTQMTGQESAQLVSEQTRLQTMNETLRNRKDQLKLDLQTKGRAAGIPPGYLRF